MQRQKTLILVTITCLVIISFIAFVMSKSVPKTTASCDPKLHIAKVNNECILRSDYQKNLERANRIMRTSESSPSADLNNPDYVLSELVQQELIGKYAKENNISVSQGEINTRYESAYKSVGTEEQYLEKLKNLQGITKENVLELIREDILKEKVQKSLKTPLEVWLKEEVKKSQIQKINP